MLCDFQLNADSFYQCTQCNWVAPRKLDKAPFRNCQSQEPNLIKPIGPGDHLHALIIQFTGETTKLGCGCKDRINQMNRWGVAGCTKNINRIVNWMQEEATKRGWKSAKWLGSKTAIKLLIRLAIRRAKNTKDIE